MITELESTVLQVVLLLVFGPLILWEAWNDRDELVAAVSRLKARHRRPRRLFRRAAWVGFATIVLIVLTGCTPQPVAVVDQGGDDSCVPPYACGPLYAGYVPAFYVAHPYGLYLSPWYSAYHVTVINHRTIVSAAPYSAARPVYRPNSPTRGFTAARYAAGAATARTAPRSSSNLFRSTTTRSSGTTRSYTSYRSGRR